MNTPPNLATDQRLRDAAKVLTPSMGGRLVELLDTVATTADELADLRSRAQRAEDVTAEVRRQMAARDRQCDRLRGQVSRVQALVVQALVDVDDARRSSGGGSYTAHVDCLSLIDALDESGHVNVGD